jgi:hypothetical protein
MIIWIYDGHHYCFYIPGSASCLWVKSGRDFLELERLFSVYKVEGKSKVLLGGLVERRKSPRGNSNGGGLVECAKRKFAELPAEDNKIFLREEK